MSNGAVGESYTVEIDAALQAAYADFVSELSLSNLCAACAVEGDRCHLLRSGNNHYTAVATYANVAGCRNVADAAVDVGNVGNGARLAGKFVEHEVASAFNVVDVDGLVFAVVEDDVHNVAFFR